MSDKPPMDEMRQCIECDNCGDTSPPHQCARCHSVYYCSKKCQTKHWRSAHKEVCATLDEMREAVGVVTLPPVHYGDTQDWQGYQKYNVAIDYRISYVDNNNNACPLCRQGIEYSIVHETLEKAKLLLNQASELDIGDAKCTQMLDTALKSVDTVLDSEPNDIRALIVKSEILVRKDPIEAVSVCRLVLDLDRKGSIIRSQMKAQIGKSTAAAMSGRHEESERLLQPVKEAIGNKDARPVQLGIGPYRLFTVRMLMAEAYEKANQWEDAQKEYMSMGQTSKDDFNGVPHKDHTTADRMHKICSGMSRCVYQLGSFKGAMSTAEVALSLDRRCPGVHKLIA